MTNPSEALRKQAANLQKTIDRLSGPRLENTPKRQCQGMAARCEAANHERTRRALVTLADAWNNGGVPAEFQSLRTKSHVAPLVARRTEHPSYYVVHESDKFRDESEAAAKFRAWVDERTAHYAELDNARARANKVREMIEKIRFVPIPGFFPTPGPLIAEMIARADIGPADEVLEPSAGAGDILVAIRQAAPDCALQFCEINHSLTDIIRARQLGACELSRDFLEVSGVQFDRILMNPPFENGQDIDHIRHAAGLLKPGGRLVSIVSASPFFASTRKATEFRDWLTGQDYELSDNPPDAFKGAFRSTPVATKMLVIHA